MATTGIYTRLGDTALGNPATSDGIAMLVVPATAESGSGGLVFELDTPYLVSNVKEITNMGVTEAVNANLLFQAEAFFAKTGNGARLWVVGYTPTAEGLTDFINNTFPQVIQDTVITSFDLRPRILGFVGLPSFVTATTASDPLVPVVVTDAVKALQLQLTNLFDDSFRMCAVFDGIMLNCASADGIISEQLATRLSDAADLQCPRIAIQVTTSKAGQTANIGDTLGIMAIISLSTSIGAMTLGPMNQVEYFLDANAGAYKNTPVSALQRAKCDEFGSKQYVFTRTRPQKSGVYFNDGATCNDPENALSSLEFLRVGNAICDSVEAYFVDLLNTNVTTTTSGEIDPAYKAATLADLDERYLSPRVRRGEAQMIQVDFWAKDGNFIQSRAIEVQVRTLPNASLHEVYIETFFVSTL